MRKNFIAAAALVTVLTTSPMLSFATDAKDSQQHKEEGPSFHSSFDARFLDTMVEHHRGGIAMMQLAVEKAQSAQIVQMANQGMKDQGKEIEQLETIREGLKEGGGEATDLTLPGMMSDDEMKTEMSKLEASTGEDFDKAFLEGMIKHHDGAVKMSDDALAKSKNPEVRKKARQIHDKQKGEISKMRTMLKEMN